MKFNSSCVFLGMEQKTSKAGNNYLVGLFQQGVETLNCMVVLDDVTKLSGLKQYCNVDIDVNCNFYNGNARLTVVGITPSVAKPDISPVDKKAV